MKTHSNAVGRSSKRWPNAVLASVVASLLASASGATPFAARETHRGLEIDGGATAAKLVPNGWLFGRAGEPTLVYRQGDAMTAGVWQTGSAAVVRSGTTESAPLVGRIVPSWKDNRLTLTIEPAGGTALRTSVFERTAGGRTSALDRSTSTREGLEGSYRATITDADGKTVGWIGLDVDPEGATRFTGDLPSSVPPALAAAAAAAVDAEVDFIYGDVVDLAPLRH